MLEIVALCSCACITTCLCGCAVAALTCPRVLSIPTRCEEPGIYQSPCPLKFHCVQNWANQTPQIYPQPPYAPNIPYPVLMCPVEYPSQNYPKPFYSTSASVQTTTSGGSSASDKDLTPRKSKVRLGLKNKKKKSTARNHGEELSALESNSEQRPAPGDLEHPPTPPPRLRRRNRLKSILKSKFKKREPDLGNSSFSNSPQNPIRMKPDIESETEIQPKVYCDGVCHKTAQNRFHCLKKFCRVSGFDVPQDTFESRRCSASHITSQNRFFPPIYKDSNICDVTLVPLNDFCHQTILCRDQSTHVADGDYCGHPKFRDRRRRNFFNK